MPDLTDEILRTQLTDAVMRPKLNGDPAGNARCWAFLRHGLEVLEGAGMLRAAGGTAPDCCDHGGSDRFDCWDCQSTGHTHDPAEPCRTGRERLGVHGRPDEETK